MEDLSAEEASCLRDWALSADWSVFYAADSDASAALVEFAPGMVQCIPDEFLSSMLAGMGVGIEDLSAEEASCLRDWALSADWSILFVADRDASAALEEFAPGMVQCVPDVFLSRLLAGLGMQMEDLSAEEASCLRNWAPSADWSVFFATESDTSAALAEFVPGIVGCVPHLLLPKNPDD